MSVCVCWAGECLGPASGIAGKLQVTVNSPQVFAKRLWGTSLFLEGPRPNSVLLSTRTSLSSPASAPPNLPRGDLQESPEGIHRSENVPTLFGWDTAQSREQQSAHRGLPGGVCPAGSLRTDQTEARGPCPPQPGVQRSRAVARGLNGPAGGPRTLQGPSSAQQSPLPAFWNRERITERSGRARARVL